MNKRLITKYPNRRLYDTQESRYITFKEIRALAQQQIPFNVIERHGKRDVTTEVLFQVLQEQECASPMLGDDVLIKLIQLHDTEMQQAVSLRLHDTLSTLAGLGGSS